MTPQDLPNASAAAEPGVAPLRRLIQDAAAGRLALAEFVPAFRAAYEQVDRPVYRSKEEARLIWDVLWALEFYSPDPSREERPGAWNDSKAVLNEIRRVAQRLGRLDVGPLHTGDPRFATFPQEAGVEQLRWYIRQAAEGQITVKEFLADFREVHERIEQVQRPVYASKEEGRAIWDVLWAVEYCSLDAAHEEKPEEWSSPEEVLAVIKKTAPKLGK